MVCRPSSSLYLLRPQGRPVDDIARRRSVEMTAWLIDRVHHGFPVDDELAYKRSKNFADKAKEAWGDELARLQLHPVVWTWFAASKCWSKSPKTFWRDFQQWLDGNAAAGRLLLIQQRSGSTKTWAKPMIQRVGAHTDFGVQPATLVFRPFRKPRASSVWRTVICEASGIATSSASTLSATGQVGLTSRSRGCEEAIKALLPGICRVTRQVTRAKSPDAAQPPFQAPALYQAELIELMSQTEGWNTVSDYARSTLEKSLSKVVKCCRGKPTGTTKVSAKRATDSERVRKRAQDSGGVVVSETKRTDAVGRKKPHAASVKRRPSGDQRGITAQERQKG